MVLDLIIEHLGSLILSIVFIISTILGKPKTAEQAKLALQKKEDKLVVKGQKLSAQLDKISTEIEETEKKLKE